jgi:hypothetical protein
MKMVFKKLSIALLFISGMGSVSADSGQHPGWREDMQAFRLQLDFEPQAQALDEEHTQKENSHRIHNSLVTQDSPSNSGHETVNGGPDEPRKAARMTPEQRRALRRQIDEANRDLYAAPH